MAEFTVKNWEDGKAISIHKTRIEAVKACNKLGHLPETAHNWKKNSFYLPVAFVQNSSGQMVYNPKFKA